MIGGAQREKGGEMDRLGRVVLGLLVGVVGLIGAFAPSRASAEPDPAAWVTVAPLPTPREGLATVTGPDGRVYAIGGEDPRNGAITSVVEAYTPATNTWATVAPMPTARMNLAAVTGPDGRIYAIGGEKESSNGAAYLSTVEAYTPSTNSWSTTAPLPSARADGAPTVGPDGRIYVIGGSNGGGLAALASVVAYDPATGAWSGVGDLPEARSGASVVTIDDSFYLVGGTTNIAFAVLNSVITYSLAVGGWSPAGSIPSPFREPFEAEHAGSPSVGLGSAVAPPHGPIYVLATRADPINNTYTNTLVTYDPTTHVALGGPPLPVGMVDPALALDDKGRLYSIGTIIPSQTGAMVMLTNPPSIQGVAPCRFVLGFATLHNAFPTTVGNCLEDEQHNAENGDAIQHTTRGLLVWRKADNFTAFTDGYRTWVNGPYGIEERLNRQRLPWEANPAGLPVVV